LPRQFDLRDISNEASPTTKNEVRDALPALQAFIDQLPKLAVVVFCGRSAQRASNHVDLPSRVQVLKTFHPGAMAYNRPTYRADIHATFEKARRLIAS